MAITGKIKEQLVRIKNEPAETLKKASEPHNGGKNRMEKMFYLLNVF